LANFATSGVEESWEESWMVEGSGMFWSSWDEGSFGVIRGKGFEMLEVLEGMVVWKDEGMVGGRRVGYFSGCLGGRGRLKKGVVNKGEAKQDIRE
jgi:hypothetical protein